MATHSVSLLTDISLGIVFAAVLGHVAHFARQPLILGYVLGGAVLGSHLGLGLVTDEASIELISEIGLILLLFIIGLEINLRELVRMGRSMLTLGVVQFFVCAGLGYLFFVKVPAGLGDGRFDRLYLSVVLALSSTLIVVKLLHDKFEIRTVAGRLTIGVLVLQDIWAIIFMAFQPNLLDPQLSGILKSLGYGTILVFLAFAASRYILGRLYHMVGRTPELVLLTSIAWCFFICGLAEKSGLSKEMGALIAGMSIAVFPYGADVTAKLGGIRDFFVTLFFVSLGLKIPTPSWELLGGALILGGVVFVTRAASLVPTAYFLGNGLRVGTLTAINLTQISEFSLVILSLGLGYGHISPKLAQTVLVAMLLMSILSTYLIQYNDKIARRAVSLAGRWGVIEAGSKDTPVHQGDGVVRDIVLLGCFRAGMAFLDHVHETAPDLKKRILVVDYNPAVKNRLEKQGFYWVYGDLAHPETLHHMGIEDASLVMCSVSDTYLKGITNRRLLRHLKRLAPRARLVMMADEQQEAQRMLDEGAHHVVVPAGLAGSHMLDHIRENLATQAN